MRGAEVIGPDRVAFSVWAPHARDVELSLARRDGATDRHAMRRMDDGAFYLEAEARPGDRYSYVVDGSKSLPDPVSRLLPEGVHGPTEIVDPGGHRWTDASWRGLPYEEYVLYELHVGTFTPEGTFDAAIGKLPYLKELGVTVLEIMPVAAFPGRWNWGYDGVSPYAVFAGYGGPEGLRRLVDAAHANGLAVVMDVVYNHFGAEGNYLRQFGPYFTEHHTTPWGEAVNFDDVGAREVRSYFVENALYWIREYHIDGLRLDAVHQIKDDSREHIVAEIARAARALGRELGRTVCITAESDQNNAAAVRPPEEGGWGLDGVWSDDFHHALYSLLTGERRGYYQDYGRLEQVARALNEGFVFQGQYFKFWDAPRGTDPADMPLPAHIVCIENHDQVGNRAWGERLTQMTGREGRRLAAALVCLAPETPLLFMGQEHDQRSPFLFFTDFGDAPLQEAVRKGRAEEFKDFGFEQVPDPQDPDTFERSKLDWNLDDEQREMLDWYKMLLRQRRSLYGAGRRTCEAKADGDALRVRFGEGARTVDVACTLPPADASSERRQAVRFSLAPSESCTPSAEQPSVA